MNISVSTGYPSFHKEGKEYEYHLFEFRNNNSCHSGVFQIGDTFLFKFMDRERDQNDVFKTYEIEAVVMSMDEESRVMVFDKFAARCNTNIINPDFLPHILFTYDCDLVNTSREWYLGGIVSPIDCETEDGWSSIDNTSVNIVSIENKTQHPEVIHSWDEVPKKLECCFNCAHAERIPNLGSSRIYCKKLLYMNSIQKMVRRSPTNSYDDLVQLPIIFYTYQSISSNSMMFDCTVDPLNICNEYDWMDRDIRDNKGG